MIEIKPQLRCSLRSAINVFEEAKLQRSLCGEFLKDQQIRAAHEAAMDANAKLKELAKLPSEKSLQEAGGIIFTALEKVADTKSAVTMFAAILEFKLLSGLETRAEIKKAITGAIAAFSDNYQQLQDLRNSQSGSQILQGNEQTEFLDDIDECIHKCNKHRATLHDINEFNARISKQIDRLKSLMPDARIKILTVQEEIRKEETIVIPEAKSTPDKINIKLSTFESSFFNRSRLCSRSIDIIENYRNEPIQARRRSP
jgi:hypothetical protein